MSRVRRASKGRHRDVRVLSVVCLAFVAACNATLGIEERELDPTLDPQDSQGTGDGSLDATSDSGSSPDGDDSSSPVDSSSPDSGTPVDSSAPPDTASPPDTTVSPDTTPVDTGVPPDTKPLDDSGPPLPDTSGVRFVFVSSDIYPANLGGLSGGDTKCQTLATKAGLPGTYKAWLSGTGTSAASRLTHATVPYVLVDFTIVATTGWAKLTSGSLNHAINLTEKGGPPPSSTITSCAGARSVFTGTKSNGTDVLEDCYEWTSTIAPGAQIGDHNSSTGDWTDRCTASVCAAMAPIYCIQQ